MRAERKAVCQISYLRSAPREPSIKSRAGGCVWWHTPLILAETEAVEYLCELEVNPNFTTQGDPISKRGKRKEGRNEAG